ncbi:GNAT family N-acetyltransferase [Psychroserpens damuponensis]|uniref:GNAT family N-acetyltransferase n=1 Tax=Psychroserpens damuponensis TaxID=943936 RepID=UPI000B313154|nr:GNAT family protein [Psychroserpens damuponensis]
MLLSTKRLELRTIKSSDKEAFFKYRSNAIANIYQDWIPKSLKEVEAYIKNKPTVPNQPNTWFQFGLIEKSSCKLIGDIGLHFIENDDKQVEIGYTLNKDFQGKGYATEALKCIINYIFIDLNKYRIFASVDPRNIPSIKLLERLGFRKEAHFEKSIYFKGEWVDDIIYELLQQEWRNKTE